MALRVEAHRRGWLRRWRADAAPASVAPAPADPVEPVEPVAAAAPRPLVPPLATTPTLRSAAHQALLEAEGYVVVDLLSDAEAEALRSTCEQTHPARSGWESDFYSPDPAVKRVVHEAISSAFERPIAEQFCSHRSLLQNFIVNWPGPDGGLVLHQHTSVVDEHRFRSVLIWCALTPATEENGTLHVVPRSHLVQQGPRPERSSSWLEPHERQLLADHLVSVPLEPGQAIVFDNQLLHCSFANDTDAPRMTAAAVVVPHEAEPRFYEAISPSVVRVHRLDPEFFLQTQAGNLEWADPSGLEVIGEEAWSPVAVDAADLPTLFGPGTCRHVPA